MVAHSKLPKLALPRAAREDRLLNLRFQGGARGEAGLVSVEHKRVLVSTVDGAFELCRAQLEGRKELPALELVNGRALKAGDVLGR